MINIEVILFSTEATKDQLYFFKKKRIIMVTNTHFYVVDRNKRYFKKKDSISEGLLAITQSLLIGSNNFVLHFKTRADSELSTEK